MFGQRALDPAFASEHSPNLPRNLSNSMGDFRFRSLLFPFLEALTKPVQPFSLRKRHVRTRPHNWTDSAHGIPKFTIGTLPFLASFGPQFRQSSRVYHSIDKTIGWWQH